MFGHIYFPILLYNCFRISLPVFTETFITFCISSLVKLPLSPFCIARMSPFLSVATVSRASAICSSSSEGSRMTTSLIFAEVQEIGGSFMGRGKLSPSSKRSAGTVVVDSAASVASDAASKRLPS